MTSIHATDSHQTFDVMKFKKIRDRLVAERLVRRKQFLSAEMLSEEDMLLVHKKEYLYSLKNPALVGRALALDYVNPWNGFGGGICLRAPHHGV